MPTDIPKMQAAALAAQRAGEYAEAIDRWLAIIALAPNWEHGYAHYNLADCYFRIGRYDEAEAAHRRAIELAPQDTMFSEALDSMVEARRKGILPEAITFAELQAVKARCQAATPGPWKSYVEGRDHWSGSDFIQTTAEDIELSGAMVMDQDFIAFARDDIPRLLVEIERLQKRLLGEIDVASAAALSDKEIEEMMESCRLATSGPWKSYVDYRDYNVGPNFISTGGADIYLTGATVADQDFIAHARRDVLLLGEEIKRLKGRLSR